MMAVVIFYTIMIVAIGGFMLVMRFAKRNEERET
jgi:positive regulator of sigma E activity